MEAESEACLGGGVSHFASSGGQRGLEQGQSLWPPLCIEQPHTLYGVLMRQVGRDGLSFLIS